MQKKNMSDIYKTLEEILVLKKLRRTGWQLRGYKDCESLSDHCFGTIFLTYFFVNIIKSSKIDAYKAICMAIIHELGEAKIGDIPFTAYNYFKDKGKRELMAISDVFEKIPSVKLEVINLFQEFENGQSIEAKLVKAMDKLDMLITALDYEKFGIRTLQDFWDNEKNFEYFAFFPEVEEFVKFLRKEREKLLKSRKN